MLGSYVLLEAIGKGGMGEVFRARQKMLERECALKIIRKDRLQSDEAVERFLREARAAAKLKDPNIVTIYDAGVTDGTHYLAMELLHGITLADKVKQDGPLSVGHACRYLRQAATGLQHAHEQGLVHRDIKPQNLFLDSAGDQVKILDLGLARITAVAADGETAPGELTMEGAVMGTPDYMAPEQAVDTHSADHRADIYSLGCTLYFLISGRPPFPGGSLTEKLLAHQQKEPVSLDQLCSGVPPRLVEVVRRAMAKQPADRYQTPTEFAAALAPFEYADNIVAAPIAKPMHAIATMTKSAQPTVVRSEEDRPARAKSSSTAIWLVVLALVAVVACCPVMLGGLTFLFLGVGTPQRPVDEDHPLEREAQPRMRPPEDQVQDMDQLEARKKAQAQINALTQASQAFAIKNNGEYPKALQDLVDAKPAYLEGADALLDPWKKPFKYDAAGPKNDGAKPDIWTVTPDKVVIGNWPGWSK